MQRHINQIVVLIQALIILSGSFRYGFSQTDQSVYFRNFVYHENMQSCKHHAPEATFTAFINNDQSRVLIENAPRLEAGDPNIDGKGTFGVELSNFADPSISVGDKISIRFTCNVTHEQGTLTDSITSIPWLRFPTTLFLKSVSLPAPPQNITLSINASQQRIISWDAIQGLTYSVFRRDCTNELPTGTARMLYVRVAENLDTNTFTDVSALPNQQYGYIVYAISADGIHSSHSPEINEIPTGFDLNIGWIARLPRIDYVWGSSNPAVEGWPLEGQSVVWVAYVKNWSDEDVAGIPYIWLLDSVKVDSGTIDIPANSFSAVDYPWSWTFERHELECVIDPANAFAEEEEKNNRLLIYTDAIAAGFWVEQSVYDYFHEYQKQLGVHSNSWEDWAQRHVRRWNQMFANAIFPDSPQGVLDRIRIDNISIVPDGALPLAGGLPSNNPNRSDRTIDLQWGFAAAMLDGDFYANHSVASDNNPFYFEGSLLHELGHARYLIDLYGFNVHDDVSGTNIKIEENGAKIVGTEYMPLISGAVHWCPIKGLMNGQYSYVDEYSAAAFNLIAGHRAIKGNYNAPDNIGIFMNDLPAENRLTLKDETGKILPEANLKIYQATGKAGDWYGKVFDNIPDLEVSVDGNGQALLGLCPFDTDGFIDHTYGISKGVIILRVEVNQRIGYGFLESTQFNMEYWRGNIEMGNYELQVKLFPPESAVRQVSEIIPEQFYLAQNFPNPFNPATRIYFQLPRQERIVMQIFDSRGREVRTLLDDTRAAGEYEVEWQATDQTGQPLASGIYFCRLRSDEFCQSRKMVLLR
ncbi:hypothetical protein JXJ21_17035 [candidate division KSB1 bacterium]|nr:hypothetical protein [candidate division KSB1 bacterium]